MGKELEVRGKIALPPAERRTLVTNWLENPSRAGQRGEQPYPHMSWLWEAYELQSKEPASTPTQSGLLQTS